MMTSPEQLETRSRRKKQAACSSLHNLNRTVDVKVSWLNVSFYGLEFSKRDVLTLQESSCSIQLK